MRVPWPAAPWATAMTCCVIAVGGMAAVAPATARAAAPATAGSPHVTGPHPARTRPIPAPLPVGRLRISGRPRDGAQVSAAGLSWRIPRFPRGMRLLTFEVGYAWQRCSARGGHCVSGADSTVTPFAAARYLVGHADTGGRLRLTETASEVVETSPATFSFQDVRRSVSVLDGAAVRPYPVHTRPRAEFINGTPERRTASTEEYFQVSAPHYNAADGQPTERYRIDRRAWRRVPASGAFYTGRLAIGPHRVQLRTANQAGATVASFGWRVVPMPAPLPCRSVRRACWYPPHLAANHRPMRWDWQIGRVTPLRRTGTHAVDI
jgi:hypothetical protein